MGFFGVLGEIGKNNKNFNKWEKEEKDKLAQREVLHEKNQPTAEEIEKAKDLGETVINVIDVMDNHSESVAENVETATAPLVGIIPLLGAFGTGFLSYKGLLKPNAKKIYDKAREFEKTEEAKSFYEKLDKYNDARWKERKGTTWYSVTSWADDNFKVSKNIKDASLRAEAEKLSKKYLKETAKYRKGLWAGVLAIPAAAIASFIGAAIGSTKLQVDSSKIARYQARKALEDPKSFVSYTSEQIAQAKAELDANPYLRKIKKEEKLKQGFFSSIKNLFRDMGEYRRAKKQDSDMSKIVTRPLSDEELKQAQRDQEVIQRTVKVINNRAERYSENMEVAADVLITGTPILGGVIGAGVSWLLGKTGVIDKFVESALNKDASEKTKQFYKEFKEVKKTSPLYHGRFIKFMKSLSEDIKAKTRTEIKTPDADIETTKRANKKPISEILKEIKPQVKAAFAHKWVKNGVFAGITALATGTAGLIIGLKLQKSAARAGRYTAKRELEEDPRNFIGYTQEDYEEVKDVKNTKPDESKFKQYALFIPRVIKQYYQYDKYRKTRYKEEQLIQEQLKKQDVSAEQLRDAKNLQRKLFNTFEKVDDNSQLYSESMEAAVEIAQPFVQYAGLTALFSPALYVMIQGLRGKMTPAQITSKITGLMSKVSGTADSKLFKKYLESVNKNIPDLVQGQYVKNKPLGALLENINLADDSVFKIVSQSWKNLRKSSANLKKVSDDDINLEIYKIRELVSSKVKTLENYANLMDNELPKEIKDSFKIFDDVLRGISYESKAVKIDILDVLLNPKTIKDLPKERYNKAIERIGKIIEQVDNKSGFVNGEWKYATRGIYEKMEKILLELSNNEQFGKLLSQEQKDAILAYSQKNFKNPEELIKILFEQENTVKLITASEKMSNILKPVMNMLPTGSLLSISGRLLEKMGPIKADKELLDLIKTFKLNIKPDENGMIQPQNLFEALKTLPKTAKKFTIGDIFKIIPEKVRDPKNVLDRYKKNIESMSDEVFAAKFEGLMSSMDRKTMLKIIGDFEKITNNIPDAEFKKIWNTLVTEFSKNPDEFVKLMQNGGLRKIIMTPELKKALAIAGISWGTFTIGATYAIQAWLAEMQLRAGRLGVMKSLEELQDPRYYANIEPTETSFNN